MSRTVRLVIGVLSWALLTIGCNITGIGTQRSANPYSTPEWPHTSEQHAIEREKEDALDNRLEAYDKAWFTISSLCGLLGSELDLVVFNSTPPDSSYYSKYYLVHLNVATRSLKENGFSGSRVNLASNALAMASQQIVDAQSAKGQLDQYFDSFNYNETLQEIQNEYEFNKPYIDRLYSEHDPMRDQPKRDAEHKTDRLNTVHAYVERDRKQLPDLIARYVSTLADLSVRLKPFLDQTNTETARKADKKSLYKDHIEKVIRLDTTLAGRFFGDDDDMVIVEPVVCEGGLLSVTIHLIIYPFSEASVANVHVYNENGQHLGLPVAKGMAVNVEGKWVDSQQFDRSPRIGELATGQEYLISQSFTADKLPAKGKLKLIITGKNVSVNCAAEYRIANNKQKTGDFASLASLPQSVTTSTKTIRCRRAGNHLWVPVEIGSGALTQQTELLLDTGASVTCIPPEIYEKLGRGNSAHEKIELETANGVISADTDVLPIKTSAFKRDIRVAFDSSNKLLGANYFTDCIFTVDVNNECIYVNRNGVQSDEYQPLMNEKKHYIGE